MPDERSPRLPRRRLLAAAGAATAAIAAGAAVIPRLPVRHWWQDVTGACGDPGPIPPTSGSQVAYGSFRSSAVPGVDVGYVLAFPQGHRLGEPLPVAVMLPGRGGTANDTMRWSCFPDFLAEAIATGTVRPFGLASVDAGDSYRHRRTSGEDRMTMQIRDFLPRIADRHGLGRELPRAVVGWSMSGYGAILAGEEHPGAFVGIAAASAALFRSYEEMLNGPGDAFDSATDFVRHDVFAKTDHLTGTPIWIDCGTADPFCTNDRSFAEALPDPPSGRWFKGCHEPDSWRVVAPEQVAFLGAVLEQAR